MNFYNLKLSDRAPDYLVMSTHVLKQRWITMARKNIMPSLFAPGYSDAALISTVRDVVADSTLTTAEMISHSQHLGHTAQELLRHSSNAMTISHQHQVRMLPLQDVVRVAAKDDRIDQIAA